MIKVGIIGGTGLTGGILIERLLHHAEVELVYLGSTTAAGQTLNEVYPDLPVSKLTFEAIDMAAIQDNKLDAVFLAVPHGKAMIYVPDLLKEGLVVIDLSADYRFPRREQYEAYYVKHQNPELLAQAVYGLVEWSRNELRDAALIACPGCYVTSALLGLYPLRSDISDIRIDAKSGVSGAGKKLDESLLFYRVNENFKAYGITTHRHQPEIETYLGQGVEFVPHLLPLHRGILSTIYFQSELSLRSLQEKLQKAYEQSSFVKMVDQEQPTLAMVTHTNNCRLGLYQGSQPNSFILISVIDNLLKGASGQAIQAMNVRYGFPETTGLI